MLLFRIGGGNEKEKWMDICNYFRKRGITFPDTMLLLLLLWALINTQNAAHFFAIFYFETG
jgi:hypothetical protein